MEHLRELEVKIIKTEINRLKSENVYNKAKLKQSKSLNKRLFAVIVFLLIFILIFIYVTIS
jgi:hypothetical protein